MKNKLKLCIEKNKELVKRNLSFQNFGNLSIRLSQNEIAIKPSGVNLNILKIEDIPIININNNKKISGRLKPSIDTNTHIEIYKRYNEIHSIAHCHSKYSTVWAQACLDIPILGTTHADFCKKSIPVTDRLRSRQIQNDYEKNIGKSIINKLKILNLNPKYCPGILVANHGVFSWGINVDQCIKNMELIEFLAETAFLTKKLNDVKKISNTLISKHFDRKHGKKAYYGQ